MLLLYCLSRGCVRFQVHNLGWPGLNNLDEVLVGLGSVKAEDLCDLEPGENPLASHLDPGVNHSLVTQGHEWVAQFHHHRLSPVVGTAGKTKAIHQHAHRGIPDVDLLADPHRAAAVEPNLYQPAATFLLDELHSIQPEMLNHMDLPWKRVSEALYCLQ
jgi:hypothetical protein